MTDFTDHDRYSEIWFRTFMDTVPPEQTAAEVSFLVSQLPLPGFERVLDICCGSGRHAVPLAGQGYDVTGVDRDGGAIARARAAAEPRTTFVQADMRRLEELHGTWDAAISMWASFGYFAPDINLGILARIRDRLRAGGRLVLDVYNRDWFSQHQGQNRRSRGGTDFTESRALRGDRLTVELQYDGLDVVDRFSWQVFTPGEITETVAAAGFRPLVLCSGFDASVPPSAERPRMQLIMECAH
jgi:SAM-dependent methyltransferase